MSRALLICFEAAEEARAGAFGQALGVPYDLLLLSGGAEGCSGAERVFQAGLGEIPPADGLASGLAGLAGDYSHIAALTSMQAKDVLARLAGLLGAAMVTDAVAVESPTVFRRPIVAGALVETVEVLHTPVAITFRSAGFRLDPRSSGSPEPITLQCSGATARTAVGAKSSGRPELTQARVIVSGGRPLKDAATFERVVGGLADVLGGAVGATRAAVDGGIAPNELQVGQTGKIVAPQLYIAAGISGSTQHMAGIKDSKVIVAINTDAQAPIFDVADFGLVMDLFVALPELTAKLK
jgi:electron transfer flavoprotein alpha subunit